MGQLGAISSITLGSAFFLRSPKSDFSFSYMNDLVSSKSYHLVFVSLSPAAFFDYLVDYVLRHINPYRLFNSKCFLCIYIKCIWFVNEEFVGKDF